MKVECVRCRHSELGLAKPKAAGTEQSDGGIKAFLRGARPDFKSNTIDSIAEKLAVVGIQTVSDLVASLNEGAGPDGVNARLRPSDL